MVEEDGGRIRKIFVIPLAHPRRRWDTRWQRRRGRLWWETPHSDGGCKFA